MSKKSNLVAPILLLITYIIGLPLFIIGIISNGEKILFTIAGLLICGLPTACVALITGKTIFSKRALKGKRFTIFFIGLLFGFIVTPICIIYMFVQIAKDKSKKEVVEDTVKAEDEPQQENSDINIEDDIEDKE